MSLSASYRWKQGKFGHSVTVAARNALDRDLLAAVARVGAGREYSVNYGLSW